MLGKGRSGGAGCGELPCVDFSLPVDCFVPVDVRTPGCFPDIGCNVFVLHPGTMALCRLVRGMLGRADVVLALFSPW